jgi:CHAT domain-containing protein
VIPLAVSRRELEERVQRLRAAVGRPSLLKTWLVEARKSAELLLAAVAERVPDAERVLILADGPLHFVPFAALPVPGPGRGRMLAELRPLHFAASVSVLSELAARRRPGRPWQAAVFADPSYGAAPGPRTASVLRGAEDRGGSLVPLPGSRREAEALRRVLGGEAALWLGPQATEERLKAVGPSVSHLHVACHGRLDARSPLDSSLALSVPAGTGPEDGTLHAWEVLEQMRLDADLVTLSACDTALGEELAGEGVLGLTQAFQFAGARAVVSTQWKIDDRSTPRLVERLYQGIRSGLSTAEALRRAQLSLMRDPATAHPFYWASFQLHGDWR